MESGDNGPCGLILKFFMINDIALGDMTHDQFKADDEGRVVRNLEQRIYGVREKRMAKVIGKPSAKKCGHTGMGLERITMVVKIKNVLRLICLVGY